jgi:ATP-dependent DNA helicase UvrD/PcrA
MPDSSQSPAERASEEARAHVFGCIDVRQSFLLEAGAGAGKTYSLIQALRYLIDRHGVRLLRQRQQVACITYTNVAVDEIRSRTDGHRAILSSTIHSFCWSLIKPFQPQMRERLLSLPGWSERLAETDGPGGRTIEYSLGYPRARKDEQHLSLGHNDVLLLTVSLLKEAKFRNLMAARYPILLIDEYQDTNKEFAYALATHVLGKEEGILIGFFGDHWQKIYDEGCGRIEHPSLQVIDKGANFRSAPMIVEVLNRMRPELPQEVSDPSAVGSVAVFHTNSWAGQRRFGQNWGGDLPTEVSNRYLDALVKKLSADGWSFEANRTKLLMLTHRVLAEKQGYSSFGDIYQYNEAYLKKEDPHIAFLVDTVEPVCLAYENKRFGDMFAALGEGTPAIESHAAKLAWAEDMDGLLALRASGTIGDVLDHLRRRERPRLPETVEEAARELDRVRQISNDEVSDAISRLRKLRDVSYQELIALARFINEETPFATKHGVKGAEFENVLVVVGRGWFRYNFVEFLEWAGAPDTIPEAEFETFERNRNLFYVVCSRPKKRLAILFTQEVTDGAMATLSNWFGREVIHSLHITNEHN